MLGAPCRLRTATADLEVFVVGSGAPVTVLLHGAGASAAESWLLAEGLPGTRVLPSLRGHGGSRAADGRYDWAALADDLAAVTAAFGARRALGVSVGAGVLARLLADRPDAFDAVVLFGPVALSTLADDVRQAAVRSVAELAAAIDAGDVEKLAGLLTRDCPPGARDLPQARDAALARARRLAGSDVGNALRGLVGTVPLPEGPHRLGRYEGRSLVVGQQGDPLHTVEVARAYAAALPTARLEVFPEHEPLWDHPLRLQQVLRAALA